MTSKWSLKWFLVLLAESVLGIWLGTAFFGRFFLVLLVLLAVPGVVIVVLLWSPTGPGARFLESVVERRRPYAPSRLSDDPRYAAMRDGQAREEENTL